MWGKFITVSAYFNYQDKPMLKSIFLVVVEIIVMPGATGCLDRLFLFCACFVLAVIAVVFSVSLFMGNWLGPGQAMATPIVNASAKHTATVSVANL